MSSARHAAPIPSTARANCHMISGFSGLPKLRQFVAPIGTPPAHATLRAASATDSCAPRYGSRYTNRPLQSTDMANARRVPLTRTTPAPMPGSTSVLVRTIWSYCRYTHRLLATVGEPSTRRNASGARGGLQRDAKESCWTSLMYVGSDIGRRYTGA